MLGSNLITKPYMTSGVRAPPNMSCDESFDMRQE